MTYTDLVNVYLFNYTSSLYREDDMTGCGCTMVEEMSEIRKKYWTGTPIEEVLGDCVCQRHGHQYCIDTDAVKQAVDGLMKGKFVGVNKVAPFVDNNKFFDGFVDFEQLYDFVASVIADIKGIGPLTVYDTAKRIGHLFDNPIYPEQYVYLSAGALDGAKVLLPNLKLKLREPRKLFEPFFCGLPSIFIEDMLCIFKNSFAKLPGLTAKDVLRKGNCVFKMVTQPTII